MTHNQYMDGLIQRCSLAHAFICRQGMHKIAHMDIGRLFPQILQRAVKRRWYSIIEFKNMRLK
jgi:hypothetical protein